MGSCGGPLVSEGQGTVGLARRALVKISARRVAEVRVHETQKQVR